ncbi:YbaB/EbfC family nucleoid-associated protein [Mycoplasma procyoni]|uniref:YbaB/EbfC family nucleoid-associated protein n=1 Tax=Mycoplasma procyoni TaxID=568784 RepID=UPI00197C1CB4|nr:YbaB/EbfC family nucleoid-associated protein [Mycoplasma procyoni]MBN3534590.1 YbaB/EbfC family nucleoid-associated protein [Mycoplasma procyoni]
MNIQEMMKQAQKAQKEILAKQKQLNETEFVFEKQGIKIVMFGNRRIKSVEINEVLIDPDDKETLEDLIILAINDAMEELDEKHESIMPKGLGF